MMAMDSLTGTTCEAVKLCPARAWRTYLGGRLIDRLHGKLDVPDGHFPEEWMMSVVSARNSGREEFTGEGLSICEATGRPLKEMIEADPALLLGAGHAKFQGATTGVLVKLIDTAERLTVQVHPDKKNARRLFDSPFGKTECWHIVGGRIIGGMPPHIYLGFKPGVTRAIWERLFETQNIEGMLSALHRFDVQPGDTFLVEGGVPHAIGPGCLLVEMQEPTDFTIRVERATPSGLSIADEMCHQGLGFEKMFECFDYRGLFREAAIKRWRIVPSISCECAAFCEKALVGYWNTPLFKMSSLKVNTKLRIKANGVFSGIFVFAGKGRIISGGSSSPCIPGDQFFIPATIDELECVAEPGAPLEIFQFWGPEIYAMNEMLRCWPGC